MLFTSIEFSIFLPVVFIIYWSLQKFNIKFQNLFLLTASYFFYGWWDWKFLGLIFFSSCMDFFIGLRIHNSIHKKFYLYISLFFNLGLLIVFKYFNFFINSFNDAFTLLGSELSINSISLVLPVGISFYTFQTLSYSIDIYKGKLKPTSNFISFLTFVSFFPQLVAGPIERAKHLLPQFNVKRVFSYSTASDGLRQILWGLFKKVVIADNCAIHVNDIFENIGQSSSLTLFIGIVLFSFQIYGDFSGYSDIAIGIAKLFGFDLMINFRTPYFSQNIAEFWRRWHVSLSTWFRDYVYFPLGGSLHSNKKTIRNIFIVFVISGLWHGANWTFIVWGSLHAFFFIFYNYSCKFKATAEEVSSFKKCIKVCLTYLAVTFAWIFFRSENIGDALDYSVSLFLNKEYFNTDLDVGNLYYLILLMLVIEWVQRAKDHGLCFKDLKLSLIQRWLVYYLILFMIWYYRSSMKIDFIYFQF